MANKLQLNNSLLDYLKNLTVLYNAQFGFNGRHVALRSGVDVEAGRYYSLEITVRSDEEVSDDIDMDIIILYTISNNDDLRDAINVMVQEHVRSLMSL